MRLREIVLLEYRSAQEEIDALRAHIGELHQEMKRYKGVGIGGGLDPRFESQRRRIKAAIDAAKERLAQVRSAEEARPEIEAGKRAFADRPPRGRGPSRPPTKLRGADLEAAIRLAVEDMSAGVPGSVSGEEIADYIRVHFGEEVARTTVDRHLSNNPNLADLDKYRKVGRSAGTTDIDREMRYHQEMRKRDRF